MKNFGKYFFKMIVVKKSFSLKSVLALFTLHASLFTLANAGLTDFKTIEEAKRAYEAKAYGKSAALFENIKPVSYTHLRAPRD